VLVDFGLQPPSNRFEHADAPGTETHPLVVGQCHACGLVQLLAPMAPSMVMSRFDWLTYNEPEGHLDDLVVRLCALPGLNHGARIVGLTYKDDTTLHRFHRLGYTNTYRCDTSADLALQNPRAGLESIQAALSTSTASQLATKHGIADLLLVRHVLEHAHDPQAFVLALRMLVRPGGYLLFEMPECTKFIQACDYNFIWEEHITYFSFHTFVTFVDKANLAVQEALAYEYSLEDSLIGIIRNDTRTIASQSGARIVAPFLADGESFARKYSDVCARMRALLLSWQRKGKRVAIFGAGHLAVKFVNLYSLHDLIECVIDDHPRKQGLQMPGSRLPIRGSAVLAQIDICLLALNMESEQKVLAKHQSFLDRGGRFLSIFARNPNSIYNESEL